VLLGGEPFRLLRLSPAGAAILDDLCGADLSGGKSSGTRSEGPAATALAARLATGGLLHPLPAARSAAVDEVTVVVPVRDDDRTVARLLEQLRAEFAGPVVVVDDGSADDSSARLQSVATAAGAVLVRRSNPGGPASARNAARSFLTSPLVAFLDADAVGEPGWLGKLLGHFEDGCLGAVAPRVRAVGHGRLAGYESVSSPLDLGPEPGLVGAHRRLSYVPTAALLCRATALDDIGWFDDALTVGEDVDLLRRLEAAGWRVRYEPRSVVRHDSRPDVVSFLRQRCRYGSSAAALERNHPGTVAPFEGNRWAVTAVLALILPFGRLRYRALLSLVATAVPARTLRSKLRQVGVASAGADAVATLAIAELGSLAGIASALRRAWWPPALAAAGLVPGWRRPIAGALLAAAVAGHVPPWWSARRAAAGAALASPCEAGEPAACNLAATLGLGALDDLAYGAGLWAGCVRHRSLRAVLPRVGQPGVSPPEEPSRSR
jgi:mycofactocin system glycosyltransferase